MERNPRGTYDDLGQCGVGCGRGLWGQNLGSGGAQVAGGHLPVLTLSYYS